LAATVGRLEETCLAHGALEAVGPVPPAFIARARAARVAHAIRTVARRRRANRLRLETLASASGAGVACLAILGTRKTLRAKETIATRLAARPGEAAALWACACTCGRADTVA